MSGFTGYNPEQVESMRSYINQTFAPKVQDAINDNLNKGIVRPISEAWFTPEGKEYFVAFNDAVKKSGPIVKDILDNFIRGLQIAANNWAGTVGAPDITLSPVDTLSLSIDAGAIQDKNSNGDMGIIEEAATKVANGAEQVKIDINNELRTLASAVSAKSAFLGYRQAEAAEDCIKRIQDEVAKIFSFLNEDGAGLSFRGAIEKVVAKYGEVGQHNAGQFNQ